MIPEPVKRVVIRNDDYSFRVGVRKATVNVAGNAVLAATPTVVLIKILRFNGWTIWPESMDLEVGGVLFTALTGITRWLADWGYMNISQPRYQAQQAAKAAEGE